MIDHLSGRNSLDEGAVRNFVCSNPKFSIRDIVDVRAVTINDIVNDYCSGVFPDFLSVDVEGLELEILKAAEFKNSRPSVVCCEFINSYGSLFSDHDSFFRDLNYFRYATIGPNSIYVDESKVGAVLS
jgi:hypothetical protein